MATATNTKTAKSGAADAKCLLTPDEFERAAKSARLSGENKEVARLLLVEGCLSKADAAERLRVKEGRVSQIVARVLENHVVQLKKARARTGAEPVQPVTVVRSRGRPVTRLEKLKSVPTRAPESLHKYLKTISLLSRYGSLTELHGAMLTRFLYTKPWEHGLEWRKPRNRGRVASTGPKSWVQVNVQVPSAIKQELIAVGKTNGVSLAALTYTAMYWWAMYIMPPSSLDQLPNTTSALSA